jgi:hypothetical protein
MRKTNSVPGRLTECDFVRVFMGHDWEFATHKAILAKRVSSLSMEQLKKLARHGASTAIAELEAEIYAIRKAFPELGRAAASAKAAGKRLGRKRTSMSAAARKAVSARMKKYWAARRAAKAGAKK